MTIYLDSYGVYLYLSGAWVNVISDVVVDPISVKFGIAGNDPLDRLADTGRLTLTLDNTTGKYSPDNASALTGWSKGVPLKLVCTYDGIDYVRFRGAVDEIGIQSGAVGTQRVFVTALDWLDYSAKYPLVNPAIATNQTADQALVLILAGMPIQPRGTDYDIGVYNFPALFDTVTIKTLAYTEFSKLVFSELGYLYLRRDRVNGETLVFENAYGRNGLRSLTTVPKTNVNSGFLLKEDGGYLLKEDGGKLILNETEVFYSNNDMLDLESVYGKNIINRMTISAYPKRVDTSAQVLYSLSSPMQIGPGQTITFRGNYSDPSGGATVNAISNTMIAPVANTDYKMWTGSDGTGTDLTANLTVAVVYGTEAPTYTVRNTSAFSAYITKLQARGYGIYSYDHIEITRDSQASYNQYGYQAETLQQQYQRDAVAGSLAADAILEREKTPRTQLTSISLSANQSVSIMQAFLNLDVGDLIHIAENKAGVDGWYYIQGGSFSIAQGGLISFDWRPRQSFSLLNGLTLVRARFNAELDGINYGYLPQVTDLGKKTYSAWIFVVSNSSECVIMGAYAGFSGNNVGVKISLLGINNYLAYLEGGDNNVDHYGQWQTTAVGLEIGLHHVVATRDASIAGSAPVLYIDGVSRAVTLLHTQTGTSSEVGCSFVVGNQNDGASPFRGDVFDARVYNRILSSAEVLALYTDGPGGSSTFSGLVFQGPCARTSELVRHTNLTLTSDDKLLDNIYGVVGTPGGAVITNDLQNVLAGVIVTGVSAGGSSVNLSHVIQSTTLTSNVMLVVEVTLRGTETISSVVRGAQAFTLKSVKAFGAGASDPRVELWYLLAPTPGTINIVVTASGNSFIQAASIDFCNVNQSVPFGTVVSNSGTGGTPAVTVAGATGDLIVDLIGVATGSITPFSSQASCWNASADGNWRGGGSAEAGDASVIMSWTLGGANKWALLGVAIKKA